MDFQNNISHCLKSMSDVRAIQHSVFVRTTHRDRPALNVFQILGTANNMSVASTRKFGDFRSNS